MKRIDLLILLVVLASGSGWGDVLIQTSFEEFQLGQPPKKLECDRQWVQGGNFVATNFSAMANGQIKGVLAEMLDE